MSEGGPGPIVAPLQRLDSIKRPLVIASLVTSLSLLLLSVEAVLLYYCLPSASALEVFPVVVMGVYAMTFLLLLIFFIAFFLDYYFLQGLRS